MVRRAQFRGRRSERRKIPEEQIKKVLELNKKPYTLAEIAKMLGITERRVRHIIHIYAKGRPKEVLREIARKAAKTRRKSERIVKQTETGIEYLRTLQKYAKKSPEEVKSALIELEEKLKRLDCEIKRSGKPIYEQPKKLLKERNLIIMSIKALKDLLKVREKK